MTEVMKCVFMGSYFDGQVYVYMQEPQQFSFFFFQFFLKIYVLYLRYESELLDLISIWEVAMYGVFEVKRGYKRFGMVL